MLFFRRFLRSACTGIPLFLGIMAVLPSQAEASMLFCNRTQNPIEAALGYRESTSWISEGWWRIEPGQCARVFGEPLTQRFYFYYATSLTPPAKGRTPFVWGGKYEFCSDTKAFKVEGDGDCEAKGYQTRGFQEIDIGSKTKDYTLDFKDGSERN